MADPQVLESPGSIAAYLRESGLIARSPKVVPLTGDASDRRYFRVFLADAAGTASAPEAKSIVLALHAGPIDFDTLPFANVAELLRRLALPVPAILGHSNALGILALEDLGDVTLQAHLGAAPPAAHAALYREAVSLIEQLQRAGTASSRLRIREISPLSDRVRRREADVGAQLLRPPLSRGVSRRGAVGGRARRARRGMDRDGRRARRRAARALPSRLSQPQPDAARRWAAHHRFPGCAHGPGHVRPRVAAARLVRRFHRRRARRAHRVFSGPQGRHRDPDLFRRRFDLMALQRNLKALGTFGYQTTTRGNPVYIQYMPRTLRYARTTLARHDRFAASERACSPPISTS